MFFIWDELKNKANKKKHTVSFEEAETIFSDKNGLFMHDPDHSDEEDRFILIGMSENLRLLVVVHAYREDDEIIRIISARTAEKPEEKAYMRGKL